MPSRLKLPSIQNQYTQGRAASGGCRNPSSNSAARPLRTRPGVMHSRPAPTHHMVSFCVFIETRRPRRPENAINPGAVFLRRLSPRFVRGPTTDMRPPASPPRRPLPQGVSHLTGDQWWPFDLGTRVGCAVETAHAGPRGSDTPLSRERGAPPVYYAVRLGLSRSGQAPGPWRQGGTPLAAGTHGGRPIHCGRSRAGAVRPARALPSANLSLPPTVGPPYGHGRVSKPDRPSTSTLSSGMACARGRA